MTDFPLGQNIAEQKLEVLTAIAANTEQQRRLLRRNSLRGVSRLLKEREALIRQFSVLVRQENAVAFFSHAGEAVRLRQAMLRKQREILESSYLLRQETAQAKQQIAQRLQALRTKRRLRRQYDPSSAAAFCGRRLNLKG